MLKKTVTYENFDGEQKTKDLYFHMSAIELGRLSTMFGEDVDIAEYFKKISDDQDVAAIIEAIEKILGLAYGERSEDGESFIKNIDVRTNFLSSFACEALIEDFMTNPMSFVDFVGKLWNAPTEAVEEAKATSLISLNKAGLNQPTTKETLNSLSGTKPVIDINELTPEQVQAIIAQSTIEKAGN